MIRRPFVHSRRQFFTKAFVAVTTGAATLAVVPAWSSTTISPAINSFSTSAAFAPPQGATITLTAVVSNEATCKISVTPAVAGFPQTFSCAPPGGENQQTVHVSATIPPNPSGVLAHYQWQLQAEPAGSQAKLSSASVSVPSRSYKVKFGAALALNVPQPTGISCSGPTFCMIVGGTGIVGVQLSKSNFKRITVKSASWRAVSCASPQMCVLLNADGYVVWNGSGLSGNNPLFDPNKTPASLTSVSCPSVTFCMMIDAAGWAVSNDVHRPPLVMYNWGQASKSTFNPHAHVSCASATQCVVADLDGDGFAWDGKGFGPADVVVTNPDGQSSLSCPPNSVSACFLTDTKGSILFVTPPSGGSSSWTVVTRSVKSRIFQHISCPDIAMCVAPDSTGGVTPVIGDRIGPRVTYLGGHTFSDASCSPSLDPTASACSLVTSDGKYRYIGHVTIVK